MNVQTFTDSQPLKQLHDRRKQMTFPFPKPGQIKQRPHNTDAVWLKIMRNEQKVVRAEQKSDTKKALEQLGEALL
jgi:hypothetical protein